MQFVRIDRDLPIPSRGRPDDAGVDLYCRTDIVLEPGQRCSAPTGVRVQIPHGFAGLVCPRSGLAVRSGIGKVNAPGVIDHGYTGEVHVLLINHGDEPVKLSRGDRIAQMLVVAVLMDEWVEVEELPGSLRGNAGFGSSGR